MTYLTQKHYSSIKDIPIKKYFTFKKYEILYNTIFQDHDFLLEIFPENPVVLHNKANLQFCIDNSIYFGAYAFISLCKDECNYNDIPKKELPSLHQKGIELWEEVNQEIIKSGFITGKYNPSLEKYSTLEEEQNFKRTYQILIHSLRTKNWQHLQKRLSQTIQVINASEEEERFELSMNKSLMSLKKNGYIIDTAYDYFVACKMVQE